MDSALERYDAFLSYRHQEPDQTLALELAQMLSDAGLQVAFDRASFAPQQPFLDEQDRCIRQSRFTVALISAAYLASGDCLEEALLTRMRDLRDRERRFIPLILEQVRLPDWMAALTGIRFNDPLATEAPRDRLKRILREHCLGPQPPLPPANPFYFGGMVLEPSRFIGRGRLLTCLQQQLVKGASWIVIGERRMGKSSLLWHLTTVTLAGTPGLEPLYLDLQRLEHCDRASWLQAVLEALHTSARARGLPWPWGAPCPDSVLLRQVCQTWTEAGHRPVLLLDEGERMGNPAQGFDRCFLEFLRSLSSARQLSLVLACRRSVALQLLEANGTSPWHNLCQTEYIGPWTPEESQALLQQGLPMLSPERQDWLRSLVGDWPGLLQYAARLAFDQADEGTFRLERALRLRLQPLLEDLWHHRSQEEQEVLEAVLHGRSVQDELELERDDLLERGLLQEAGGSLSLGGTLWRDFVFREATRGGRRT